MRDGIIIYVDIYLPPDLKPEERVAVLIAWSPYGKTAGTAPRYINLLICLEWGINGQVASQNLKAQILIIGVIKDMPYNPDPRGIARSEGNITKIGSQEPNDCYDLIE